MKKEYVNSHNHSYLKVEPLSDLPGKLRYQYQILTTKKMEGVLGADFQINNGDIGLYYDISSMQNLKTWFAKRKIDALFMEKLILSLQTALWSLEQYLLDDRNLILDPEYIFQDMESDKLLFFYYPYYAESEEISAEPLFSFLTEKVDEDEIEAVEAIYRLYEKWENMKENFLASTMVRLWPKDISIKEENFPEPEKVCTVNEEEFLYNEDIPEKEERKLYGNGRSNRRVLILRDLPTIIGRKAEASDIVIEDVSVGKMHVKISEEDGHIYMEDLNAPGGTYKNGLQLRPYEKVELLREDEIKLGRLEFTYR
ncbi:MAG: DUF6382 domain-containing protein [Lachnospiraceae bacterium]